MRFNCASKASSDLPKATNTSPARVSRALPLVLGVNHQPSNRAGAFPLDRSNRTDNTIATARLEYFPVGELGTQFRQRLGERRDRPIVVENGLGVICELLQV